MITQGQFIFGMVLWLAAIIDWKTKEVPDDISLICWIIGIIQLTEIPEFTTHIIATILIGLITLIIHYKNLWGGADTKIYPSIALMLGLNNILTWFLGITIVVSIPYILYYKFCTKEKTIPFIPVFAIAYTITILSIAPTK